MEDLKEVLDVFGGIIIGIITALGYFFLRKGKGQATTIQAEAEAAATVTQAKAVAHKAHAEADAREVLARQTLDEATREWADRLIERYDNEATELRTDLRTERARHAVQLQRLEAENEKNRAQMQAQIDSLRTALQVERQRHEEQARKAETVNKQRCDEMQAQINALRVENTRIVAENDKLRDMVQRGGYL